LDWLAATFVEDNWSIKSMHQRIMSSSAYQRSCSINSTKSFSRAELEATHAVFRPRRLSAEEIRDAMLSVSGELNDAIGGIPNRPEINLEAALQPRQVIGTFASAWVPNPLPSQRHQRSLYALRVRGLRDPFMEVFNEPAPDFPCEGRELSTVTPQVFSLFNGKASHDRALALAAKLIKSSQIDQQVVEQLFALAYGRQPHPKEISTVVEHWQEAIANPARTIPDTVLPPHEIVRDAVEENTGEKFSFVEPLYAYKDLVPDLQPSQVDSRTRALADICLVVFNSNEFVYVY